MRKLKTVCLVLCYSCSVYFFATKVNNTRRILCRFSNAFNWILKFGGSRQQSEPDSPNVRWRLTQYETYKPFNNSDRANSIIHAPHTVNHDISNCPIHNSASATFRALAQTNKSYATNEFGISNCGVNSTAFGGNVAWHRLSENVMLSSTLLLDEFEGRSRKTYSKTFDFFSHAFWCTGHRFYEWIGFTEHESKGNENKFYSKIEWKSTMNDAVVLLKLQSAWMFA